MAPTIDSLLILGASGDLTKRLLLPGLAGLLHERRLTLPLVGAGQETLTERSWQARVRRSFASTKLTSTHLDQTVAGSRYLQADVTDPADLQQLIDACPGTPALYFALPPAVTAKACAALRSVRYPAGMALVLEKPFGTDYKSARALNQALAKLVPEDQTHRVDHFLGRSDVLNIIGTRFANRLFEPVWNNQHVAGIEIVFDESLTLENRAGYYDHAGALVDMIQSHLLQVMTMLTMEPPATVHSRDLHDAKAQVMRATHLFGTASEAGRRARYTAGTIGRSKVPSYIHEQGVDPKRGTETLAELTVEVRTWRWAGVPITLRSGKSLGHSRKEAVVTFKKLPALPEGFTGTDDRDRLTIGFQPARMALGIAVNGPGDPFSLDRVELKADLASGELEAYGEVLAGVLDGDPTLSVRGDVSEQCWRIVDPVIRAWQDDKVPMDTYQAGSRGPSRWAAPKLAD